MGLSLTEWPLLPKAPPKPDATTEAVGVTLRFAGDLVQGLLGCGIEAVGEDGVETVEASGCQGKAAIQGKEEAAPAKQKNKGNGVTEIGAGAKTLAPKTAAPTMAGANATPAAASQARATTQPKPPSLQSANENAAPTIGKPRGQPAAKQVTAMEVELRGVEAYVVMCKREGNAERKL